jgi:EAL and modified HD-GYP domain-containing signal transduction protein
MPNLEHLFIHPLLGKDQHWSAYLLETASAGALDETLLLHLGEPAVNVFSAQKMPAAGSQDFLLLSCNHARPPPAHCEQGQAGQVTIIATDVHSHADFEWAKNKGCTLFTAEFLLNHQPSGKKADLTRLKLLQLLSLIVADADTAEIEAILRQEPKLAYSLLRLVNSAANAPRNPITSFSQAINLLGRRQLQRWFQLLVYATPDNGQQTNPLLQKAAVRGRILELLAPRLDNAAGHSDGFRDLAFMAGTFSLLDVLLNMPMKEVLQPLPLPPMLRAALAEHAGVLGKALKALNAAESRDLLAAEQQWQALAIDPVTYLEAQVAALHWARGITATE